MVPERLRLYTCRQMVLLGRIRGLMAAAAHLSAPLARGLVVALLGLLLFPALAPALDHHFAERQPWHGHLYTGHALPEHSHLAGAWHSHGHRPADEGPRAAAGGLSEGVAFLAQDDGMTPLGAVASLIAQDLAVHGPLEASAPTPEAVPSESSLLPQLFPPPPAKPPTPLR